MFLSVRMWNKAVALSVVMVIALLAAACGGDDPTPTPAPTRAPAGPVATSTPIPTKALWEIEWDATVEAANAEGEVTVAIFRVDDRVAIEKFTDFFPQIKVNALVAGGGGSWSRRVAPERSAGIYSTDVYLTGSTSAIRIIQGGRTSADPLLGDTRSILIRPDILEDSNWIGGFEAQWISTDRKHLFKLIANGGDSAIWVNTNEVDIATLKTPQDLLRPEFIGRISSDDPSNPGSGATFFTELLVTNGEALTRQILGNLQISEDGRQLATDVINGNKWISVGPAMDDFLVEGIGRHVVQLPLQLGGIAPEFADKIRITCCGENDGTVAGFYSAGIGGPALVANPPHPNAAKIFINWLLSTDGSRAWFEANPRDCSPRHDLQDICTNHPKLEEGKGYVTFQDEGNVPFRRAAQDVAADVFGN